MDPRVAQLQQKYGLPDEIQGRPLSEFDLFENVPFIDTFEDEDINATPEFLQKVVKVNNDRTLDTGDMSPLILGHTDDDKSEKDQPPIVGWALDYKLESRFGRVNPRPAVLGSMLVHNSLSQTIKEKFPRRSVEVFQDGLIDPIALLGATAPRRSLTLLSQSERAVALKRNHNQPRWRFSASELCADPDNNGIQKGVLSMDESTKKEIAGMIQEGIESSPLGKLAAKLMEDDPSLTDPAMEDPMVQMENEVSPDELLTEEEVTTEDPEKLEGEETLPPTEADIAAIVSELVEADTPEQVQTALAKLGKARKAAQAAKLRLAKVTLAGRLKPATLRKSANSSNSSNDSIRLELNQLKTRLAKAENEAAQLKAREGQNATKLRHKERESELIQLESEGYEFDLPAEFDHVKDLPEKQFASHLSRIRANYKKAPIGSSSLVRLSMLRTDDDSDGKSIGNRPKKLSEEESEHRIKLAAQKRTESYKKSGVKMSMREALKAVDQELSAAAG